MNVKTLGKKVHLDSGTLTPLLKRLEGKGLISRSRSKEDERVRIITLSPDGLNLRQTAEEVPTSMLCKTKMTIDELQQLKVTCDTLLKNLNQSD